MNVDLELLTVARNYAVKLEIEFKKARAAWRERFQTLDDELQSLYTERDALKKELKETKKATLAGR